MSLCKNLIGNLIGVEERWVLSSILVILFAVGLGCKDTALQNDSSKQSSEGDVPDSDSNQPPVAENMSFSVEEGSVANTLLGRLSAVDPEGQLPVFVILSGNEFGVFALDSLTGQLTLENAEALDFSTHPSYELLVGVSDGLSQITITVAIAVLPQSSGGSSAGDGGSGADGGDSGQDSGGSSLLPSESIQLAEKTILPLSSFSGGQYVTGAANIEASQTSCYAPCGVHFKANVTGSMGSARPYHELAYHWDFDDSGSVFTALPSGFIHGYNANHAQGPMAGHVFKDPGLYTVILRVANKSGQTTVVEQVIDVADPNVTFSGSNTICVSQNNDFSGCPSGAQQVASISSAASIGLQRYDSNPYRILLRAGETFNMSSGLSIRDSGPRFIGSFGVGSNPKMSVGAIGTIFYVDNVAGLSFQNLEFEGDYSPVTGLGDTHSVTAFFLQNANDVTIDSIQSSGIGITFYLASGEGAVVANSTATNWYDYGTFQYNTSKVAMIGNTITQNPNAVSGTGAKDRSTPPLWADHGPIRITNADEFLIYHNRLFSITGWSSDGLGHQPTIRYHTGAGTSPTASNHMGLISKNDLEGGYTALALHSQNGATEQNIGNLLVERNRIQATSNTIWVVELEYGNTTLRNNIMVMPDVVSDGIVPFIGFVNYSQSRASSSANSAAPREIYGNTMYQQQSSPGSALSGISTTTGNESVMTEFTNLIYSPNTSDGLYTSNPQFDSDFRPAASFVENSTADNKLFDTFFGELRDSNVTAGAVQK